MQNKSMVLELHSDEQLSDHAMYACDTRRCHGKEAFSGMGAFAKEDIHERGDIKPACCDLHHSSLHTHEKDTPQMSAKANELRFTIERFLSNEADQSPFPAKTSSASNNRMQPHMSPQVEERANRPLQSVKPLCIPTNDNGLKHEDRVVDMCRLIAESQHTNISTQEPAKASELYTPRSALSRRRSPSGYHAEIVKKVSFDSTAPPPGTDSSPPQEQPHPQQPTKQHSKKKGLLQKTQSHSNEISNSNDESKQENYALFRTRSAKVERQLSRLLSRQQQEQEKEQVGDMHGRRSHTVSEGSVSAGRYFDALKGPELEILKDSEEVLLPLDKTWPFLLRFPIGCFGICLGIASLSILWKVLATSPSMTFLHAHLAVNFILWCLALVALVVIFGTYALKCLFYFEAVRREFHHPVRVNFFFAPWIICMFLALGMPPSISTSIHPALWCVFTTPLLILELKVYGQWLSGGQRRLSKVANPSTHLSLVGNFVAALLAAQIGWTEPAIFFWAVGCAHYLVLFVTLYQRLTTTETLPKELHPVFFLFVAAPSTASVAWKFIIGDFDNVSRMAYFLAMFLYASLVVRVKFFCGFKFSITWWAYTFPMTASAIAAINYSMEVRSPFTQALAVTLSVIATVTVMMVFICTILHVLWGSLFPNDIAIAITPRRHKKKQKAKANPISFNKVSNDHSKAHIVERSNCLMKTN